MPIRYAGYHNAVQDNIYFDFYTDMVNNKDLPAKEFFKYIEDKYNLKRFDHIYLKVETMEGTVSSYKAEKLRTIIEYKKACLNNDIAKINELKDAFDSIKKEESDTTVMLKKNKPFVPNIKKREKNSNLSDEQLYLKSRRLSRHEKNIDINRVLNYIIEKNEIKTINKKDLDDLRKVIKFFIKNLEINYGELLLCQYIVTTRKEELNSLDKRIKTKEKTLINIIYKDEEEKDEIKKVLEKFYHEKDKLIDMIDSYGNTAKKIYIKGEESLKDHIANNLGRLCTWKVKKLEVYIKLYKKVLDYIDTFIKTLENKDDIGKISTIAIDIDDEFIIEILNDIHNFIIGYRDVSKTIVSDKKLCKIKDDYIKKLYID